MPKPSIYEIILDLAGSWALRDNVHVDLEFDDLQVLGATELAKIVMSD